MVKKIYGLFKKRVNPRLVRQGKSMSPPLQSGFTTKAKAEKSLKNVKLAVKDGALPKRYANYKVIRLQ